MVFFHLPLYAMVAIVITVALAVCGLLTLLGLPAMTYFTWFIAFLVGILIGAFIIFGIKAISEIRGGKNKYFTDAEMEEVANITDGKFASKDKNYSREYTTQEIKD